MANKLLECILLKTLQVWQEILLLSVQPVSWSSWKVRKYEVENISPIHRIHA